MLTVKQLQRRTMYGKVFSSMYDGTLATKGPWQALVTFQQMIVLADKNGVVDMTADAISRRTSIPREIIDIGIRELSEPDCESRSPDEDGRRIVLLEGHRTWGWQIVNYAKYAALRSAEERREYMRIAQAEHRARVKASSDASINVMTSQDKTGDVKMSTHVPVPVPVPVKNISTPDGVSPRKRGSSGVEGFDLFWAAYPRKTAKAAALKDFSKLAPSVDQLDDMLQAISTQRTGKQWLAGFIPHPATWINGRRWEDEQLPVGALIPEITVPGLAAVAQTSALLAEMGEAGRRSQSPEAQAARIAAMARLRAAAA